MDLPPLPAGDPATDLPPPPVLTAPADAPPLPGAIPEATMEVQGGRPSALRCGAAAFHDGGCRYQAVSGVVTTYYPDGSVYQVLPLSEGLLSGVVEVYDPAGRLILRRAFLNGRPVTPAELPADAPVAVAAAAAPPVGAGAPVPMVASSPPALPPPSAMGVSARPRRDPLAIGAMGSIGGLASAAVTSAYGGVHLQLLKPFGRLRVEGLVGVLFARNTDRAYERLDVPLGLGLHYDFSDGPASFYLVGAASATYARRSALGDVPGPQTETAWLLGGDGGIGLRGSGERFSFYLDMRLGGAARVDGAPRVLLPTTDNASADAIGRMFRVLFNLGFSYSLGPR